MTSMQVSSADPHLRRRVRVLDTEMSYVDVGDGDPIVFLHGNPTSSYLWRNIIPFLRGSGRCLAPDLVGMGQSGPAPDWGLPVCRSRALPRRVVRGARPEAPSRAGPARLGVGLGFYRALRYPAHVKAIAYMEAIVQPRRWADFPSGRAAMFQRFAVGRGRAARHGRELLRRNGAPAKHHPGAGRRRDGGVPRAFRERPARRPTLVWPRELPIDGEPADVVEIVEHYGAWLARSALPKL